MALRWERRDLQGLEPRWVLYDERQKMLLRIMWSQTRGVWRLVSERPTNFRKDLEDIRRETPEQEIKAIAVAEWRLGQ